MSVWYSVFSLALGLLLVAPYLFLAERLSLRYLPLLFGGGLLIAACIYLGFAWYADMRWLPTESLGVLAYGMSWLLGARFSLYWLALGWGLHPLWDIALHLMGPGVHIVPDWYALACVSFDLAVASYIFSRVRSEMRGAKFTAANDRAEAS